MQSAPQQPAVAEGIAKATREGHVRLLMGFRAWLRAQNQQMMRQRVVLGLIAWLEECREERRWKWQSMTRYMASAAGAFCRLTQYTADAPCNVFLNLESEWRDAMTRAQTRVNQQPIAAAPAVETKQACKMLDRAILQKKLAAKPALLLLLCWFTAGRPGDVLRLLRSCIQLDADPRDPSQVAVEFRVHKTNAHRGAFLVQTTIPERYRAFLVAQLRDKRSHDFIIPVPTASERREVMTAMRDYLRTADATFSVRSLRRGTLQALGQSPANGLEVVMAYSGHTRPSTSMHYVEQGRKLSKWRQTTANAAHALNARRH
jgi:integrase